MRNFSLFHLAGLVAAVLADETILNRVRIHILIHFIHTHLLPNMTFFHDQLTVFGSTLSFLLHFPMILKSKQI